MGTESQARKIALLEAKGYVPYYTHEDGTVALVKPKSPNRHGLHASMAVATGGLWIFTGWIGQPLAKTDRTTYVSPDRETEDMSGYGLLGLLSLLALLAFIFLVAYLWPLFLALGAILLVVLGAVLAVRFVRVARSWLTPPPQFLAD